MARCQEIPYDGQYNFWGVRYYDLRLYVNKNNHIMAKNSVYEYSLFSLYEILDYFDKRGDVVVKVTLDATMENFMSNEYKRIENKFKDICYIIDGIYKNVIFTGGTRLFDNRQIYTFKPRKSNYRDMKVISPVEFSPVYRFVSKWMPFLIDRLNRKYIEKFRDKRVFLVLNYVNRQ